MIESGLLLIFPVAVIFAAAADFLTFTIPNRIVLGLLAGYFVAASVADLSWLTLSYHLVAGFVALLLGFAMFARGWVGGGDAKLIAAVALWLGFDPLLPFVLWTAILGGGLALLVLAYRRLLPPIWLLGKSWAMRLHDPKEGIPYGVAIAGAGLLVFPSTGWVNGFA